MDKQTNLKIKGIVFDFDGTLFDLNIDWVDLKNELAKTFLRFGYRSNFKPLYPEIYRLLHLIKTVHDEKAYFKQKATVFDIIKSRELFGVTEGAPKYYAKELLYRLKNGGIPFGIATINSSDVVKKTFQKYSWPSGLVVGRETVEREKPHPESISLILKTLKIDSGSVFGVGNSYSDAASYKLAGIKKVFILKDTISQIDKKIFIYNSQGEKVGKPVLVNKITFIDSLKELIKWI